MGNEANSGAIRVLVVDDHELFRIGLERLLAHEGFVVATGSGVQPGTTPDVVVRGVNRPVDSADDVAALAGTTAVLVLALVLDEAHVLRAVQAGAAGYLLKDSDLGQIVVAIRDVAAGHSALSAPVARVLVDHARCAGAARPAEPSALSPRERQVLALLASGCDNAEIGDTLFVSRSTVKNHVSRLLEKLEVANRVQAAAYAVRSGLV